MGVVGFGFVLGFGFGATTAEAPALPAVSSVEPSDVEALGTGAALGTTGAALGAAATGGAVSTVATGTGAIGFGGSGGATTGDAAVVGGSLGERSANVTAPITTTAATIKPKTRRFEFVRAGMLA